MVKSMIRLYNLLLKLLENRVNVLGVSEPHIQVEDPDRIRVQLAGKNPDEARKFCLHKQI